jgi:hypothetical protein
MQIDTSVALQSILDEADLAQSLRNERGNEHASDHYQN